MEHRVEDITKRLNLIVEPFLSRDASGKLIEEIGYIRRAHLWPINERRGAYKGRLRWILVAESPPEYLNSTQLEFAYCPSDVTFVPAHKDAVPIRFAKGFYIRSNYAGDDLEIALGDFKAEVDYLKNRIGR